jgi:HEAT repeat protein
VGHLSGPRLSARLFRIRRNVVPETAWTPDALADWVFASKGRTAAAALPAIVRELGRAETAPRRRLARAVAQLGPLAEPAVPALALALADPDAEVRFWSATALARVGAPAATARAALEVLRSDPDPDVRLAALQALAVVDR